MMDGPAAGSRGVGPVFHGRIGDGATLTLDVAPAAARRGGAASNRVYKAFHDDTKKSLGLVERNERSSAHKRKQRPAVEVEVVEVEAGDWPTGRKVAGRLALLDLGPAAGAPADWPVVLC
jgi:hypothetical protein